MPFFEDNVKVGGTLPGLAQGAFLVGGASEVLNQLSTSLLQLTGGALVFGDPITVGAPTASGHATTKSYVDALANGFSVKAPCRVATTANITLSGAQTIDGVSVIAGDRVLVKNQSTGSQNGLYVCASGAWARATDADADAEVKSGLFILINEGTVSADTSYVLTTNDPIVVGSTSLTFTKFSALGQVTAGNGLSKSGDTLSIDTSVTADLASDQTFAGTKTFGVAPKITGLNAGDLLVGGVISNITTVADVATGQVLASAGVGVSPAYTASPSLTNLTLSGNLHTKQATDVASATTLTLTGLATNGNVFVITGNTTIQGIVTTGWQDGDQIALFISHTSTGPTITHASGAPGTNAVALYLRGNVNWVTTGFATGREVLVLKLCTRSGTRGWYEISRSFGLDTQTPGFTVVANGQGNFLTIGSSAYTPTGITAVNAVGPYTLAVSGSTTCFAISGRWEEKQGADVASANNLVLGSDGNLFCITGNTQINLLSRLDWQNGSNITLLFASNPTVKSGQATSGNNTKILLAGGSDFVASADDMLTLRLCTDGTTVAWREIGRSVN